MNDSKNYLDLWEQRLNLKFSALQAELNALVDNQQVITTRHWSKKTPAELPRALERLATKYSNHYKISITNEYELQKNGIEI
jgi:hypothetical protein